MPYHSCVLSVGLCSIHVAPESVDIQMFPCVTAAASLVPSLDDVMPNHRCVLAVHSCVVGVHVSPESVDVQMWPLLTVAASLVPSLDDVISLQSRVVGADSSSACVCLSVHVVPKSVDVQMFPPMTTTASLVPSLDDVM